MTWCRELVRPTDRVAEAAVVPQTRVALYWVEELKRLVPVE